MADNTTRTPGTGETWAADDIGGVLHQRVKLTVGADGAGSDWEGAVTVAGVATAANQTTIIGHVDGIEGLLAGTLTISGSVTANAGTNLNTSTLATAANQTTIIGHVDGIETLIGTTNSTLTTIDGRVDGIETLIGTTNSTLTTIDGRVDGIETLIGTTNTTLTTIDGRVDTLESLIGTTNTNTGASTTALQIIDDWDESDRCKSNIIVGQAGIAADVGATGATVPRVVIANNAGRALASTGGSASSSGNNTLVAAGSARLKVHAFSLSTTSATAVTCIFQSGAGGTELWRVVLQAPTSVSTGANLAVTPPAWLFATASATLLNLNLSGAITVHWSVSYCDEA